MGIIPGRTYRIVNVRAGSVLDLSGTDGHAVIGWQWKGGNNQKWILELEDGAWIFRNIEHGKFLGIAGVQVKFGTRLAGSDFPVHWDIRPEEEDTSIYRILVPRQQCPLNVELSENGNGHNGTPIHLWGQWPASHQNWRFEEV
ncbi:hypothetical protein TWF730_002068 [Orbilia blumenaviensis]|uniref:Ricin B lectin domain-containing protein n=1 Tax=Orbilia blumenaviensis TaxID=1796055 RepID=A0AAV9UH64_9PEZI